jgi:hypothetical protein
MTTYLPTVGTTKPIAERLFGRVTENDTGCLLWGGAMLPNGYGYIGYKGKSRYVHRVAYELTFGVIPEGLTVDHLCYNRSCVNVEHMELVTPLVNSQRMRKALATHCPEGHEYGAYRRANGRRRCQECARIKARAKREVDKATR